MDPEIRTFEPNDKALHTSYQTTTNVRPVNVTQVNSNEPAVEHRENQRFSPLYSTAEHVLTEAEQAVWARIRRLMQEPFSEFFGVFVMILFGDGVVAQVILSSSTRGDYQSISWCWGIGVMIGVYVAKKSGGHINPGVTLSNCIYRGFPWRKLPIYVVAQVLGAMAAAAVVYGNYMSAIDAFEGGPGIRTVGLNTSSAAIFCTYPAPFMTRTGMFFNEFIGSAILMFCIYALVDAGAGDLLPLCLFFLVFGIGATFGWQTGYAINLARDFGPRLVSYMLGYGTEVWSAGGYYFWIPMVAPFLGCVFGGFLHDVFLYPGETPINTPWMGLQRLTTPRARVPLFNRSKSISNV